MPNASKRFSLAVVLGVAGLTCAVSVVTTRTSISAPAQAQKPREAATGERVMPQYDQGGALKLPESYRRWVFVGASLGLNYTEGGRPGMEMFHETLMEPTAYEHFTETGTFREGSMFVLLLHGIGEGVLPARRGRFASKLHSVEMAVKDSAHRQEGWAYYNFGGMFGIRDTAEAMPKASCYNCHVQHAKRDNVFLQFYPLLEEAAPKAVASHGMAEPAATSRHAAAAARTSPILDE